MAIPENELTDGEVLFEEMNLGGIVNFPAFRQAVQGYNKIEQKKMKTLKEMTKAEAMSYAKEAARYCKENNLLRPGEVEKLKQENRLAPVLIARMELHKKAHPEK